MNDTKAEADSSLLNRSLGVAALRPSFLLGVVRIASKITAELVIPATRANGAFPSQGGRFDLWSLYVRDGRRLRVLVR